MPGGGPQTETMAITQGHLRHDAESPPAAPIDADYLLVPPRVCTRVPMHRIASYGTRWPAEPRCMFTVPRCGGLFVWDCRELAHSYCRSAPWTVGGIGLVRHSHLPS